MKSKPKKTTQAQSGTVTQLHGSERTKRDHKKTDSDPVTIGWCEWMSLPELKIPAIRVKADTGARTSCIHALNIEPFEKDGKEHVNFLVAPVQQFDDYLIPCCAPVVDQRVIRDSGGHTELRYVVETLLRFGESHERIIKITLTSRETMQFRMLLGRTALMPDLIVDANSSYRLGHTEEKLHYPELFKNDA